MKHHYQLFIKTFLLILLLGVAILWSPGLIRDWVIVPVEAHCKEGTAHSGNHRHCTNPPPIPPPDEFVPTHEVDVGCKVPDKSSCAVDFFDRGTEGIEDLFTDLPLPCVLFEGGRVECGHDSDFDPNDPRPWIDISGLFHLWENNGRGSPEVCFPAGFAEGEHGIIDPRVSVGPGAAGEYNINLFFQDEVDTNPALSPNCEDSNGVDVSYELRIGPCFLSEIPPSDPFPPSVGEETVITCFKPLELAGIESAEVTVKQTSGGGKLKKCGCEANGTLKETTTIWVRGL